MHKEIWHIYKVYNLFFFCWQCGKNICFQWALIHKIMVNGRPAHSTEYENERTENVFYQNIILTLFLFQETGQGNFSYTIGRFLYFF